MKLKSLQLLHFTSTALLIVSVSYTVASSLHQQGVQWWVIFSISGPSLVLAFVMTSVYLYAIFKGASRRQEALEHPLTSSTQYLSFYDSAPFLGAFGGILGMAGVVNLNEYLLGISYAILSITFFVWMILDPTISFIEDLIPKNRKLRNARLQKKKAEKEQQQVAREALLESILAKIETNQQKWRDQLAEKPNKLIDIATQYEITDHTGACLAVDIGVEAWQIGGHNCMNYLIDLTKEECQKREISPLYTNHISYWWDGIGNWNTTLQQR